MVPWLLNGTQRAAMAKPPLSSFVTLTPKWATCNARVLPRPLIGGHELGPDRERTRLKFSSYMKQIITLHIHAPWASKVKGLYNAQRTITRSCVDYAYTSTLT